MFAIATSRVCFRNLSFNIDEATLKEAFAECGELSDIHWLEDKETGKFYGVGFGNFDSVEAATKAVALDGKDVMGRPIKVEFARAKAAGGNNTPRNNNNNAGGRTPQRRLSLQVLARVCQAYGLRSMLSSSLRSLALNNATR